MEKVVLVVRKAAVDGKDEDGEAGNVEKDKIVVVEGGEILVPFAKPLANEKVTKKALKTIKKGAKSKCLKRGVKEVVKSIRKSPSSSISSAPHGIVVLAADISPMDVISHIPVLCEDHNIPYVFVQSRAELGLAGGTKRPTSVVMIVPALVRGKKSTKEGKESKKEDEEGLKEAYDELVKAVKALQ
ncbi:50S ribosomal protein L30e-like protein [Terfezia claveryi]|nr:50S ribosomal protein L30e-like protein [Terfezia claveryi]